MITAWDPRKVEGAVKPFRDQKPRWRVRGSVKRHGRQAISSQPSITRHCHWTTLNPAILKLAKQLQNETKYAAADFVLPYLNRVGEKKGEAARGRFAHTPSTVVAQRRTLSDTAVCDCHRPNTNDYETAAMRRRIIPAAPTSPVASRTRLEGSGVTAVTVETLTSSSAM